MLRSRRAIAVFICCSVAPVSALRAVGKAQRASPLTAASPLRVQVQEDRADALAAQRGGRDVLLVGNSPNVLEYKFGPYIDNQTDLEVVRFNQVGSSQASNKSSLLFDAAETARFAPFVGNRTDVVVVNGYVWYHELRAKPLDAKVRIAEVSGSRYYAEVLDHAEWRSALLSQAWQSYAGGPEWPTSGLIAIAHYLADPSVSRVYLHGFSFSGQHYFNTSAPGAKHHNYTAERAVVLREVAAGKAFWLKDHPGACCAVEGNISLRGLAFSSEGGTVV
mmetsp:Transcript_101807/g.296836  ORF Transcript_101807/g.296836 Transcript_101807/m.296836 type:complete len:277 (+) Transcript_101807:113-943(+)